MKHPRVLWAVACGFLLVAGCGNQLKEFTSPEGKFKVMMPATPKEGTQTVNGITVKSYNFQEKGGTYSVSFMELPAGQSDAELQARLEGLSSSWVRELEAKNTNSSKITYNQIYPGRELEADLPAQMHIRARYYLKGRVVYKISVLGDKPWASSAKASKFLDSLVILQ
jgi:hypothetical protein